MKSNHLFNFLIVILTDPYSNDSQDLTYLLENFLLKLELF
jgi:hypothetical protein